MGKPNSKQVADEVKDKVLEQKAVEIGLDKTFNRPTAELPIVKALAIVRIGDTPNFTLTEFTIQGDKILSVKADEPMARFSAQDCFKIRAQRLFME